MIYGYSCAVHGTTTAYWNGKAMVCVECIRFPYHIGWCSVHGDTMQFVETDTAQSKCIECHRNRPQLDPTAVSRDAVRNAELRVYRVERAVSYYRSLAVLLTFVAALFAITIAVNLCFSFTRRQ